MAIPHASPRADGDPRAGGTEWRAWPSGIARLLVAWTRGDAVGEAFGLLHERESNACSFGLGPLCFYFCAIMLVTIMLSEFAILDRDYATYMLV